jgi:hypothetical protein
MGTKYAKIPVYATGGSINIDPPGKKKASIKSKYTPTITKSRIKDNYYTDPSYDSEIRNYLAVSRQKGYQPTSYKTTKFSRGKDKYGEYTSAYDPNYFENKGIKKMFGSNDEYYNRYYDVVEKKRGVYPLIKGAGAKQEKMIDSLDELTWKKDEIPLSGNTITLTQGKNRGAKVDKNILDEVIKDSKKKGTNPNDLLALMSRETTFGSGRGLYKGAKGVKKADKKLLLSAWDVHKESYPYNLNRHLADNKVPGIKETKMAKNRGIVYDIEDSTAVENYLEKNPKVLQDYDKKLKNIKPAQSSFEGAIDIIKKKGYSAYNPGDPDYTNKISKEKKLVESEPELQKYIKANANKYAMGGLIRPSSRKRHIAPLVVGAISAGLSLIGGISASAKAKRAKEEARLASLKQEQDALRASASQQAQADAQVLANFEEEGQEGVQYYKKGGEIADNQVSGQTSLTNPYSRQGGGLRPNLPVSNGGYQTKGGNLVPIGDGVELAIGNRHNDTKIDGVSGIQLSQDGEPVAEIEHKEVLADGNVVYSDRLKYDGKKSYADMMIALTKKRNKLESKQDKSNSKAEKNTLDRQLAGLNMAEETLFKTQELHKEMEGKQVLNSIYAYGGRTPGRPLPVPKWAQTFLTKQRGGKYNDYGVNGLNDYRDPNNPDVVISQNGNPKYPYDETLTPIKPYTPKMLTAPIDASAGMSNGSGELLKGITNAATTVVGSFGTDSNKNNVAPSTVTTPTSVTNSNTQSRSSIDWGKVLGVAGNLAPKLIDNLVNRAQTRNAPQLPTLLHATATPLETRVNINPALADIRRRTATLRRSVLDNTSNSNNAKSNMVATSLQAGRQADELLVGKENQEMALRNANAQNRQAVNNANVAQDNERAMMEFQRQNDLNTLRSANASNLVGDITSTINEFRVGQQFDADVQANLMDDPMGSKAILYAQDSDFMSNKTNRDFMFRLAKTRKNPVLVKYLQDNYNYTE